MAWVAESELHAADVKEKRLFYLHNPGDRHIPIRQTQKKADAPLRKNILRSVHPPCDIHKPDSVKRPVAESPRNHFSCLRVIPRSPSLSTNRLFPAETARLPLKRRPKS